ncbi:hypothetical protein [Amycolatopsis samaneae]|uniref:Uncharacterized protein n=1 Tax=Amycolatopsis samaneae TaxID=664691 RepID=A0ABW5GSJ7_9PSEU
MRGPRHLPRLVLVLGSCVTLAMTAFTPAVAQPGHDTRRVKAASLAEIRRSVVPEGGIKAAMSGGNTVDAVVREPRPRADGYRHIDTPSLVAKLRREGLNTYVYGIWDAPTDWDDLRTEFAPVAAAAGIRIWVYVVPPSECFDDPVPSRSGRCSRPYKLDFVTWAREIAKLSVRYPNVVAWAIDDFLIGQNGQLFTPEYMHKIVDAQDAVNPKLGFYTTAYYSDAISPAFYERFAPFIDGIVYPYLGFTSNTQDPAAVRPNLDAILAQAKPRDMGVLFLLYTNRFLDAALPPDENYVAASIQAALPYARDGRILGINNYGLPLGDKPNITAGNRAAHGIGRLSVALPSFIGTRPGDYAGAEQRVRVDTAAAGKSLSFVDYDGNYGNLGGAGYHFKQLLVDGAVAWESDVTDPGGFGWVRHTVDLTEALRGKESATITLRILDRNGVGDFPLDVGFDDVTGEGLTVVNGGFENDRGWRLVSDNRALLPSLDHYVQDRPARIREAVATTLRGLPFVNRPYPPEPPTRGYRTDDSAMYGHGRLGFTVPERTATRAGACASASQVVGVDRSSARYEISFWDRDQYARTPAAQGHLVKRALVDGQVVYEHDVADWWAGLWMNGESGQGPIDVTEFARGKDEVTLAFQLCTTSPAADLAVDVGVDNVETIGLAVRNPGFEWNGDWTLRSDDPGVTPAIRVARR